MSLRLHPEHGLNPAMSICFWCGETKELLLLGYNDGKEAPREVLLDYEPCDKCKEQMDLGIMLIQVTTTPQTKGQTPMGENGPYPTGAWSVVKEEAMRKMLQNSPELLLQVLEQRKAFVPKEVWEAIGL